MPKQVTADNITQLMDKDAWLALDDEYVAAYAFQAATST